MARPNNTPAKGAFPYPRSPVAETAPHDPAHAHTGYQQSYEPPAHAAHSHTGQAGAPRDIFAALRPDQGLTSRIEAYATPRQDAYGHGHANPSAHAPRAQDGYGRGGYADPAGQPYPAQGAYGHGEHEYDPYGRPLPGGSAYPSHGGYPAEPALDLANRYPQGQGYAAPHDPYARGDAHGYDDPYRTDVAQPAYGAYGEQPGAGRGADGEYYADDYADDAEPETRRGPRAIVVVGALLAAIGLGGGLAYGYKSLTNGGSGGGKLPILRADGAPAKALPADPGGKQIPHTDKKFLNRLTEDRSAPRPVPVSILPPPTSEREASGDGGTRRVPTLVVNRDGSIAPTSAVPSSPPPPVNRVPGMVIEGLAPRTSPPPPLRPSVAEEARPEPVQQAPRRVASAQPLAAVEPPAAVASVVRPPVESEAKRRPPAVRQAARTTSDAAAPAAAPLAAAPAATTGYVAVLSSRRSHMDALKAFADIQQKYTGVLQGRTPDVREANLGEKGIWYRVVVGPPGSKDSANGVCSQLKSQGYSDCWIMTY